MIKGETSTGFKYEIDENYLTDWEMLTELSKLCNMDDDANELEFIVVMSKIEKFLFADKGKALEKHIKKNNNGRIPSIVMLTELVEILKTSKAKN